MIDRLIIYLLLAGCLVFGAIIFGELESAGTDSSKMAEVAPRPDAAPAVRRPQNQRPDELLAIILARPLFSNTRRPPQSAPTEAATDSDLSDARLTGIVTEPGYRIAIFAVNGAKPLKVIEGEAVSGWRIETITPREVSLSGPTGIKTLQPKFDPNLAAPPGALAASNAVGRVPAPPGIPTAANAGARPPAAGAPRPAVPPISIPPITSPGTPLTRPGRTERRQ